MRQWFNNERFDVGIRKAFYYQKSWVYESVHVLIFRVNHFLLSDKID